MQNLTSKLFTNHGNQGITPVTAILIVVHGSSSLESASSIGHSLIFNKILHFNFQHLFVRISTESKTPHVNVKVEFPYFNKLMKFTSNKRYFHPLKFLKQDTIIKTSRGRYYIILTHEF